MNNNEILIQKIYDKTIDEILLGIEKQFEEEIRLSYMEYLKKNYLEFDLELGNKSLEELIILFADLEVSTWKNTSAESKLSELLSDSAFEKIKNISNTGYKYARERLSKKISADTKKFIPPVIDEEEAQNNIHMLHMYLEQVRNFNINIAKYYVSEGIIDFQYACGITENTSLRIGKI